VGAITDKLLRRHPHVFADAQVSDAQAQTEAWEAHKAEERRGAVGDGVLDGVAKALPAVTRAMKLQKRAARVGFDWPDILPVLDKIHEEVDEILYELERHGHQHRLEDEVGDLFFACTNLARHAKVDPETALRLANAKFERRFRVMEAMAKEQGQSVTALDIETWETFWERAKAQEV
jgi:ATP diphosphatase